MLNSIKEWLVVSPQSLSGVAWAKDLKGGSWAKKGSPALTYLNSSGYYNGKLGGRDIRAHRAVFALTHGYLPAAVDHIDGDTKNNNPENLRDVSLSENQHNQRKALGCSFNKGAGKWRAQIGLDGVAYHLGTFDTFEDARAAYLAAKLHYHPTSPINSESTKCQHRIQRLS